MRSVAFVLYVIDDLTNLPIGWGQLRAHIPGMVPPVYKGADGYGFLDLPREAIRPLLKARRTRASG